MKLEILENKHEKSYFILATQLQQLIGYLGIALPFLLYFFVLTVDQHTAPLPSISHYYYTRAAGLFSMLIAVIALFLFFYKGDIENKRSDDWITTLAAICAILVILLPTNNLDTTNTNLADVIVTTLPKDYIRENSHLAAAALFFICLAYILFFRFPKIEEKQIEDLNKSFQKGFAIESEDLKKEKEKLIKEHEKRNKVFKISAILLIVTLIVLAVSLYINYKESSPAFTQFYSSIYGTFLLESIMIFVFGVSWLIKGNDYFGRVEKRLLSLNGDTTS